jgi:hypothetical protein
VFAKSESAYAHISNPLFFVLNVNLRSIVALKYLTILRAKKWSSAFYSS